MTTEAAFVEADCEDQALAPTKTCTICVVGWTDYTPPQTNEPIYAPLEKLGQFWCCSHCGASYGANPHPDLR